MQHFYNLKFNIHSRQLIWETNIFNNNFQNFKQFLTTFDSTVDFDFSLTHFMPQVSLDTPWRHQKTRRFQRVSKETSCMKWVKCKYCSGWQFCNISLIKMLSRKNIPTIWTELTTVSVKLKIVVLNNFTYDKLWASVQCMKSVQMRSFFWSVFSRIPSKYGKIQTRKTPCLDNFYAVVSLIISCYVGMV